MEVVTDYNGIGKILYLLSEAGIEPVHSDYTDKVTLQILVPAEQMERLRAKMVDATAGKAEFHCGEELYFIDKE